MGTNREKVREDLVKTLDYGGGEFVVKLNEKAVLLRNEKPEKIYETGRYDIGKSTDELSLKFISLKDQELTVSSNGYEFNFEYSLNDFEELQDLSLKKHTINLRYDVSVKIKFRVISEDYGILQLVCGLGSPKLDLFDATLEAIRYAQYLTQSSIKAGFDPQNSLRNALQEGIKAYFVYNAELLGVEVVYVQIDNPVIYPDILEKLNEIDEIIITSTTTHIPAWILYIQKYLPNYFEQQLKDRKDVAIKILDSHNMGTQIPPKLLELAFKSIGRLDTPSPEMNLTSSNSRSDMTVTNVNSSEAEKKKQFSEISEVKLSSSKSNVETKLGRKLINHKLILQGHPSKQDTFYLFTLSEMENESRFLHDGNGNDYSVLIQIKKVQEEFDCKIITSFDKTGSIGKEFEEFCDDLTETSEFIIETLTKLQLN